MGVRNQHVRRTMIFEVYRRRRYTFHTRRRGRAVHTDGTRIPAALKKKKITTSVHPTPSRANTTYFPHTLPQFTLSCEHLTLPTRFFPHAHTFSVKNGHGGHGPPSPPSPSVPTPNPSSAVSAPATTTPSWHTWGTCGCPHAGAGRAHGYTHLSRVPHEIGGSSTVRPQRQTSSSNTPRGQTPHAPRWSRRVQRWFPQPRTRPHGRSHACRSFSSSTSSAPGRGSRRLEDLDAAARCRDASDARGQQMRPH